MLCYPQNKLSILFLTPSHNFFFFLPSNIKLKRSFTINCSMLWQHFCPSYPFKGDNIQKMLCECASSITPLKAFQSYLQDIMWIFPTCTLEEQQQNLVAAQQSSVQVFSAQQNIVCLVSPALSNLSKVFDSCLSDEMNRDPSSAGHCTPVLDYNCGTM